MKIALITEGVLGLASFAAFFFAPAGWTPFCVIGAAVAMGAMVLTWAKRGERG